MRQDVFVDRHEQSDIVEDRKNFLNKMEELKSNMVEFKKDGTIKPKIYFSNCEVDRNNCQPIIVITYNERTFSANDLVQRA